MKRLLMRAILLFVFVASGILDVSAQDSIPPSAIDLKYVEDQFYVAGTYNILTNRPENIKQNNLSYGFQLGFIKDFPVNERRNVAIGIGLGYAINAYYQNLLASEENGTISYQPVPDSVTYKRNKIGTHVLELPIEFRWRTSTPESHKFWRVYTGVKLGYVFSNTSKFVPENGSKVSFTNSDVARFQYGIYMAFGYNTLNFYASYQLNGLLEGHVQTLDGQAVEMRPLQIGLIFYLL